MGILNQQQKKEIVLNFLDKDYSYRDIQKRVHVSPAFITQVKQEMLGEDYVFKNRPNKISKNTQAIELIGNGKKLMEIAVKLNMDSTEVHKAYSDYLKLKNLDNFTDLINPTNSEKFNLLLMITTIFHQKGITDKDSISKILAALTNMKNLQEQIKRETNSKIALKNEIVNLQSYVNELKQLIAVKKSFLSYFNNDLKTVKNEIVKKEERLEQVKKLCRDIYDMKAYDHLQNTLIDNIENVILKQDQFIPLIMMAVAEALRADPEKRRSLDEYCKKFKNEKLALDNIDSRIAFFQSSEFWDDTSFYFQRLTEIYSQEIFAFVLEEHYKLYKIKQKRNSYYI